MDGTISEVLTSEGAGSVLKYFTSSGFILTLIAIVFTIAIVIVLSKLTGFYLKRQREINNGHMDSQRITLVHVTGSIISGLIIFISIIFILQVNGIQVSSLITSVSIISAIIGLALQDTIKDIIQGIQILSDKFFRVGDVIRIGDYQGIVTKFTMRSTKIYDLRLLNEVTVANRNLTMIEKANEHQILKIPVSYDEPVKKMFEIFEEIAVKLNEVEGITGGMLLGLSEVADSAMIYSLRFDCDPRLMIKRRRDALRLALETLDEHGVHVPYNQLDVHFDNPVINEK